MPEDSRSRQGGREGAEQGWHHAGGRARRPQGAPWEPRRLQEPKVLAQDKLLLIMS